MLDQLSTNSEDLPMYISIEIIENEIFVDI